MLEILPEMVSPEVSLKMVYGLGFMFFTLLVASVSDLKSMTIKAEFLTMWLGFSAIMFWHDYITGTELMWWKWGLITTLGIFSWKGIGKIFSLARADVVAVSAVCSVLEIPYILLFYIILILVNKVGLYPLKIFGKKDKYPFMPVIWFSLVLLILLLGVIEWNAVWEFISGFT